MPRRAMEYDDLLPWEAERWRLKRGACLPLQGFSNAFYIILHQRFKDLWDKKGYFSKIQRQGCHVNTNRKHICNNVKRKCPCLLEKRETERKKEKEAGEEGGTLEPCKLKSIYRKMFICRSVKLTRGVYLPVLPSHPLCYHLLRSLSLS